MIISVWKSFEVIVTHVLRRWFHPLWVCNLYYKNTQPYLHSCCTLVHKLSCQFGRMGGLKRENEVVWEQVLKNERKFVLGSSKKINHSNILSFETIWRTRFTEMIYSASNKIAYELIEKYDRKTLDTIKTINLIITL